jgi:FKBP-type peptidyl-prolyl cis-trans isomerase (trigger factor)
MQILIKEPQEVDMAIDNFSMEIEKNLTNKKKTWMKRNIKRKYLRTMKIKYIIEINKRMKTRWAKNISKNLVNILQTNDSQTTLINKINMLNNT